MYIHLKNQHTRDNRHIHHPQSVLRFLMLPPPSGNQLPASVPQSAFSRVLNKKNYMECTLFLSHFLHLA